MYNEDNNEYPTFDDPYVEYYWERQGISFIGRDFKLYRRGEGPIELIETDTFEPN